MQRVTQPSDFLKRDAYPFTQRTALRSDIYVFKGGRAKKSLCLPHGAKQSSQVLLFYKPHFV